RGRPGEPGERGQGRRTRQQDAAEIVPALAQMARVVSADHGQGREPSDRQQEGSHPVGAGRPVGPVDSGPDDVPEDTDRQRHDAVDQDESATVPALPWFPAGRWHGGGGTPCLTGYFGTGYFGRRIARGHTHLPPSCKGGR